MQTLARVGVWPWLVLLCLVRPVLAADLPPETKALLRTFREEFVELKPGQGNFPPSVVLGEGEENVATREVILASTFHMARYEVPQNLWQSVMGKNPSRWQGNRNSVEMLSFAEAQEFCERATQLMRDARLIAADEVIRLPSEAEWEYAARAGTKTRWSFGQTAEKIDEFAWYHGNAAGNDPAVGAKKPNAWGLYDMHGYLWEWCADAWTSDVQEIPANGAPGSSTKKDVSRVARGGSWKDHAEKTTSSSRAEWKPDSRDDALGLRCVLAKVK